MIHKAVQSEIPLDQLPLIMERTLLLKQHIETGLIYIEGKIKDMTAQPSPQTSTITPQTHSAIAT
jgi:hypothetical protein